MITEKIRKVGDSFVITIPFEEIERQGLGEGDLISIEILRMIGPSELPTDIKEAFDRTRQQFKADLDYLAPR